MKMIVAVINKSDAVKVSRDLQKIDVLFTKILSKGWGLRNRKMILIIGIEEQKVEKILAIIHSRASTRIVSIPNISYVEHVGCIYAPPAKSVVGGATVFVTELERLEEM